MERGINFKRFLKKPDFRTSVILIGIFIVALLGFMIYQAVVFHVIRTDPKMSRVSNVAPYIKVYFNKDLDDGSLKFSDSAGIVTSTEIDGKVLTFNFKDNLTIDQDYTLTITNITSSKGGSVKNKSFKFTPKNIPSSGLSKQQQKDLIGGQDEDIYDVSHINYPGFDDLLDYGITPEQQQNIQQLLFDYSNIVTTKFWTMRLVSDSIVVADHDAESTESTEKADFTVRLGDTSYRAHIEYSLEYDSVYMQLRKVDGTLVYDSANGSDL
ncbi:hypothetical protein BH09PAT3_BH09PAT3_5060 [soil metagenome]